MGVPRKAKHTHRHPRKRESWFYQGSASYVLLHLQKAYDAGRSYHSNESWLSLSCNIVLLSVEISPVQLRQDHVGIALSSQRALLLLPGPSPRFFFPGPFCRECTLQLAPGPSSLCATRLSRANYISLLGARRGRLDAVTESQAIQDKIDFGGIQIQPAIFASVVQHLKKTKEKQTWRKTIVRSAKFPLSSNSLFWIQADHTQLERIGISSKQRS
jgi:hypothetical protein